MQFTSFSTPQYSASSAIRTLLMAGGVASTRTCQTSVEERPPTEWTVMLSSRTPAESALTATPELVELTFWHPAPSTQISYVGIGPSGSSSSDSCASQARCI